MRNLTQILFLSSFGLASMIYSQNYGYDQSQQYQNRQPSYQGNNPQYSQQGYSQGQPQYTQGQPQYNDQRYRNPNDQRYDSQRYYNTTGATATNKPADDSSWSNWLGKDDKKPVVPDEAISSRVIQNLRSTPYFSNGAKNIEVTTKEGEVTLKGRVLNKNEMNQIEYMVNNVEGVKSVDNELETEK